MKNQTRRNGGNRLRKMYRNPCRVVLSTKSDHVSCLVGARGASAGEEFIVPMVIESSRVVMPMKRSVESALEGIYTGQS